MLFRSNHHTIIKTILLPELRKGINIDERFFRTLRQKLKPIADQCNVELDTLYSALRHPERPHTILNCCFGFGVTFGMNTDDLREKIERDDGDFLKDDHLRNHPLCNSQWLAKQRLPCFVENPRTFKELVELLAQQDKDYYKLKPSQIEKHWWKHTIPRLGQLASRY